MKEPSKLDEENGDIYVGELTDEMRSYEKETGKYAVWRSLVTEGFKKWAKGEKVYNRDKERISLYVSEATKERWADFIKYNNYSTISKLIRDSVQTFIDDRNRNLNPNTISNISHALKEPLTSIKGYSQLLLETYQDQLSNGVLETVRNIFDQSIDMENKIINFLDNIKGQNTKYDILLIEDDLATIRLITSFFENKGINCKGMVSGNKGLKELNNSTPKVVLLDIILPDISGYDICKKIKSINEDLPVYFLTAISESEVKSHINETGADGYILKPFNFTDFNKIIDILGKK